MQYYGGECNSSFQECLEALAILNENTVPQQVSSIQSENFMNRRKLRFSSLPYNSNVFSTAVFWLILRYDPAILYTFHTSGPLNILFLLLAVPNLLVFLENFSFFLWDAVQPLPFLGSFPWNTFLRCCFHWFPTGK